MERAPEGFTEKVMMRIQAVGAVKEPPLLSISSWIAIFLGLAALLIMIFVIDIPFFDRMMTSTGMHEFTSYLVSKNPFQSFVGIFKGLNLSSISLVIIVAAAVLGILERLIFRKISSANLLIL